MIKIGQRWAEDDFTAFEIAQGIENAGGDVFSISYRGQSTYDQATAAHAQYIVWFKVPEDIDFDAIDASIDKELSPEQDLEGEDE
jgi:hypothetical protein